MNNSIATQTKLTALMTHGEELQQTIEGLAVTNDNSACIMAHHTRDAVTLAAEIEGYFSTAVAIAYQEHKSKKKEQNVCAGASGTAAAEGRLKLESWANEQYELAKEAAENDDIPTRLFPDMDGVTFSPKLVPTVVNEGDFFKWCIETGNTHLIKTDLTALKKYVNSAGSAARSIPGANVKVQYSVTIRKL